MARKRMFTMDILDSDAFLDMPLSAQCLYFHLNMRADDDGFISNPKRIARMINASDDDIRLLIAKRFVLVVNDDGVIVIKHWRMHNTIQSDRYIPTVYQEEMNNLYLKNNKAYTFDKSNGNKMFPKCIQNVSKMETMETMFPKCIQNVSTGIDIDIDIDIDKENSIYEEEKIPFITLTLNDLSEYPIYQEDINKYKELYPAVNIEQQIRNMKGWLNSNPTKRKTKRGINRFVNGWLARAQDKGAVISYSNMSKPNFIAEDELKTEEADIKMISEALFGKE